MAGSSAGALSGLNESAVPGAAWNGSRPQLHDSYATADAAVPPPPPPPASLRSADSGRTGGSGGGGSPAASVAALRAKAFYSEAVTGPAAAAAEPVCLCRMRAIGEISFHTWYSFSKSLLYLLEFVWAIVVFGVTANTIYKGDSCPLSDSDSTALCRYAIALGVVGWVLVLIIAAVYFGSNATGRGLPFLYEAFVHAFLVIWWFIGSVIISSNLGSSSPNQASINTVVAFSWMIFVWHSAHTGICVAQWRQPVKFEDFAPNEMEMPGGAESTRTSPSRNHRRAST